LESRCEFGYNLHIEEARAEAPTPDVRCERVLPSPLFRCPLRTATAGGPALWTTGASNRRSAMPWCSLCVGGVMGLASVLIMPTTLLHAAASFSNNFDASTTNSLWTGTRNYGWSDSRMRPTTRRAEVNLCSSALRRRAARHRRFAPFGVADPWNILHLVL
jgi:hypothetical protein